MWVGDLVKTRCDAWEKAVSRNEQWVWCDIGGTSARGRIGAISGMNLRLWINVWLEIRDTFCTIWHVTIGRQKAAVIMSRFMIYECDNSSTPHVHSENIRPASYCKLWTSHDRCDVGVGNTIHRQSGHSTTPRQATIRNSVWIIRSVQLLQPQPRNRRKCGENLHTIVVQKGENGIWASKMCWETLSAGRRKWECESTGQSHSRGTTIQLTWLRRVNDPAAPGQAQLKLFFGACNPISTFLHNKIREVLSERQSTSRVQNIFLFLHYFLVPPCANCTAHTPH